MNDALGPTGQLLLAIIVIALLWFATRLNDRFFDWVKGKMSYRAFITLSLFEAVLSAAFVAVFAWRFLQRPMVTP